MLARHAAGPDPKFNINLHSHQPCYHPWGNYASKDWPDAEKGFASMISNIDRDIGKLLARLRELGIDDIGNSANEVASRLS